MNIIKFKENSMESKKTVEKMVDEMLSKIIDSGVRIYTEGESAYDPPNILKNKYESIPFDLDEKSIVKHENNREGKIFDFEMTYSSISQGTRKTTSMEIRIWPIGSSKEGSRFDYANLLGKFEEFFKKTYKQEFPKEDFLKKYEEYGEFNEKFETLLDAIVIRVIASPEKYPIVKVKLG